MVEREYVDWRKVLLLSVVGAIVPVLLGVVVQRSLDAEFREATRVRWTDAARWER